MVQHDVTLADPLGAELRALNAVGKALAELQDPDARVRVLRWAAERFQTIPVSASVSVTPSAEPSEDPMLTVDNLQDLFERPKLTLVPKQQPNGHEDLSDLYDTPVSAAPPQSDVVAPEEVPVDTLVAPEEVPVETLVAAVEVPLDTLVADFVKDFQRLTLECESV